MSSRKKAKTASSMQGRHALARYRSMRDFTVTHEPRSKGTKRRTAPANKLLPFVVQKHAASHLHYDLRLGWDGVLKSWAVAIGPSYNPADKWLAIQVEDHPWEYQGFEGTIPRGEYGGGTVMAWDKGDWIPHGDVDQGLKDGHLKFALRGKKLKGDWVLVRMHGRAGGGDNPNWLLIKEKDKFARRNSERAITDEGGSAISGRSLDEVAKSSDREWPSEPKSEMMGSSAAQKDGGMGRWPA